MIPISSLQAHPVLTKPVGHGPVSPQPNPPKSPYPEPIGNGFNYGRSSADRWSRYEARERRRDGDWGILAFPRAFLWLGDTCVPDPFGELDCAASPAVVDLWP